MITKLPAILLLIGVVMLGYAFSLSPYTDAELFNQHYMALPMGQSEAYWKLRDDMLTPKFQLQDYGVTLVIVAVTLLFVSRKGWGQLQSPASPIKVVGIAFLPPCRWPLRTVHAILQLKFGQVCHANCLYPLNFTCLAVPLAATLSCERKQHLRSVT